MLGARFFAVLPLVFLLLFGQAFASNCVVCGQAISGRYARTDRGDVCERCYMRIMQMQRQQQQPGGAQSCVCEKCGKPISGSGARTRTGFVCMSCYRSMARKCDSCGRVITGKGVTDGRNYYCGECGEKISGGDVRDGGTASGVRCSRCSRPITGTYAEGRDSEGRSLVYCMECARASGGLPRSVKCSKCNSVIRDGNFKSEKDKYGNFVYTCSKCASGVNDYFRDGTRCAVCRKVIDDSSCYKNFNGLPFCVSCGERYPERCMACGLPVPQGRGARNGSYLTCEYCSRDVVTTDAQLKELYAKACSFFKGYLGMTVPVPPEKVRFSDMSVMSGDLEKYKTDETPRDYGNRAIGLFTRDESGMSISVQKGMPRLQTLSTLVHESGHACMAKYGMKHPTLVFSEGFAVWCEYRMLSSIGETKYYTKKQENADPIYGEGLRRMLELESRVSSNGILDYMTKHNDFPSK